MRHGHNKALTEHDGGRNTHDRRNVSHVNKRRGQETKTSLKQMKGEGDLNTGVKTRGESNKQ